MSVVKPLTDPNDEIIIIDDINHDYDNCFIDVGCDITIESTINCHKYDDNPDDDEGVHEMDIDNDNDDDIGDDIPSSKSPSSASQWSFQWSKAQSECRININNDNCPLIVSSDDHCPDDHCPDDHNADSNIHQSVCFKRIDVKRRSASTESVVVSSDSSSSTSSSSGCISDIDASETPSSPDSQSSLSIAKSNDLSPSPLNTVSLAEVQSDITSTIGICGSDTVHTVSTGTLEPETESKSISSLAPSSSFCCKWTNCDWPGNYDDLVDHIREIHVELQPYQRHNWSASLSHESKKLSALSLSKNTSKKSLSKTQNNDDDNEKDDDRKRSQGLSKNHHESSQQYVCLWEGCKVYGKGSLSRNWLERHVLQHSGPRPFKCIVERCGARFKMQSALERHVNSHFKPHLEFTSNCCNSEMSQTSMISESIYCNHHESAMESSSVPSANSFPSSSSMMIPPLSSFMCPSDSSSHAAMMRVKCFDPSICMLKDNCYGNVTPNKILKRKKSATKLRRKCLIVKGCDDFFDECVMEKVRFGLIQMNATMGLDISGNNGNNITFHSGIIGRRENENGEVNVLLHWNPPDILPDVWIPEHEMVQHRTKVVSISSLPSDTLLNLLTFDFGSSTASSSQPKIKQRRK